MYEYILFDLDGTLTDPGEGITRCVQYALGKMGVDEPDRKRLEVFIGPPLSDSFRDFYGMSREEAERAVAFYRERFADRGLYENIPYPGMDRMLSGLCRRGKHLAVASSKPEHFVRKILEHFGLEQYFEAVVGSNMDGTRVRKEEVVQEALLRLFGEQPDGLPDACRERIVMVGDRKFDIQGARALGLRAVGVTYGYAQPGELEAAGADRLADTVEQLGRILTE